jgi:hypothetical protein
MLGLPSGDFSSGLRRQSEGMDTFGLWLGFVHWRDPLLHKA